MPELDLSFLTPPTAPLDAAQLESLRLDLHQFVHDVRERIAAERPAENSAENQVTVQPGGKTFSTIGAAIASISDASQKKQYVCYIGPGTYAERVICKSWVFLAGSGPDQTIVTAPAGKDKNTNGTVVGAANSAIQDMAVVSMANGVKSLATAVVCNSIKNFDIENCAVSSLDLEGGAIAVPVAVDYAPGAAASVVYLAYSEATVSAEHPETDTLGVFAANYSFVQLTSCRVTVKSPGGWGAAAAYKSQLTIDGSYVEGTDYSLKIVDLAATLIANQCTLVGPVGSGVIVNP